MQGFSPADPRCIPLYEALAHYHKLPLLSHTGGETVADPRERRLGRRRGCWKPALQRGVTVIAAHCGTRSSFMEEDHFDEWATMIREYPNLYGDTAALNLPARNHAFGDLLQNDLLRSRIVHGSDWPVISIPPLNRLGGGASVEMMRESNWMKRDVLVKQRLGFGKDYFERAAEILRLPNTAGV